MAGPEMGGLDNINKIDQIIQKEKAELAEKFDNLNNQIKTNPESLDKISKDALKNIESYISLDKNWSFDMYINILESLKNSDKLWKRDKESLNKIKETIKEKYLNVETEIAGYQLKKDIFNASFDVEKLKEIGSSFQTPARAADWFSKIPENYDWKNTKINEMCEGKLYTAEQLVKWLFDKNEERRKKINDIVSKIDISKLSWINITKKFDAWSENATIIVKEIKKEWWELADDYREYDDFITAEVIEWWKKEVSEVAIEPVIEGNKAEYQETEVSENSDLILEFSRKSILKIEGVDNWNSWGNSKLSEIIDVVKIKDNDQEQTKIGKGELIKLLNAWNVKWFQMKIWLEEWSGWNQADGKLGKYSLDKLKNYLSNVSNSNLTADWNTNVVSEWSENLNSNDKNTNIPRRKIEDSKDFISKNIDYNTRKAYAELFEISNNTGISTFFKKSLNSITNEDVKDMQKSLVGIRFDYKWIKTGFKSSDMDWNFWSKTLAALKSLVEDYSKKRFDFMKESVENSQYLWKNLNWTFVDFIIKSNKSVPITLIDGKIVRKISEKNYSVFDQNSWVWKWVSTIDPLYKTINDFNVNLMVNNIPDFKQKTPDFTIPTNTHVSSTTYVATPTVNSPFKNTGNNTSSSWTDQNKSELRQG